MKATEIKDLSLADLNEKVEIEKQKLVKLKINHAVSPVENPILIRDTRKVIARLNTELRRRELENTNK